MRNSVDRGSELVIGLVGPIGVDLDAVASALEQALERVSYQMRQLHLIDLLSGLLPGVITSAGASMDRRYRERMDAGNRFRKALQRGDALALLAMAAIRDERGNEGKGNTKDPIERCAYLLRSLKTPEEVGILREVYGASCHVVAAYASREHRRIRGGR
jgi:hypothetical protein